MVLSPTAKFKTQDYTPNLKHLFYAVLQFYCLNQKVKLKNCFLFRFNLICLEDTSIPSTIY
nr:MAG TPA: hypothetical protein [Caudoviricetes sp.]